MTPGTPGIGVDAFGGSLIDPTENVRQLVQAETKRQDDLRELDGEWRDKVDEIRAAHSARIDRIRSDHTREIRHAETERIDAIRAVDIGNVQRAAEVQATQALALATQVTALAETVRVQVQAVVAPIQNDIADLRRSQSESVGQKTQVVETHARGGSIAIWIGVGLTVVGLLNAVIVAAIGIYLSTR